MRIELNESFFNSCLKKATSELQANIVTDETKHFLDFSSFLLKHLNAEINASKEDFSDILLMTANLSQQVHCIEYTNRQRNTQSSV